jgi:hypothetical protein
MANRIFADTNKYYGIQTNRRTIDDTPGCT